MLETAGDAGAVASQRRRHTTSDQCHDLVSPTADAMSPEASRNQSQTVHPAETVGRGYGVDPPLALGTVVPNLRLKTAAIPSPRRPSTGSPQVLRAALRRLPEVARSPRHEHRRGIWWATAIGVTWS